MPAFGPTFPSNFKENRAVVLGQEDGVGLREGEKGLGFSKVGDMRCAACCTSTSCRVCYQRFLGQS